MTTGFTDLPILAELGSDLEQAWREAEAPPRRRFRRPARLRPSLVVALVLVAMLLAAAALAASGLLGGGAPLKPPRGTSRDPHSGLGVSRAGSAQVLPVAVADPAGDPPWGLRYVTTSRGLGCLQAGRLVDGKIGVLGQDGAFADDGRFHPLTRNYLGGIAAPFACGTVDAHGHAFASVAMNGVPASGLLQPSATQPGCVAHRDHGPLGARQKKIPICPRKDWRLVYYGMAGPEAKSVTYAAGGERLRTVPTVGEQGAYLIVLKASIHLRGLAQYTSLDSAGAGLVRVTYRDGSVCRVAAAGDVIRPCPHVGEVPVRRRSPSGTGARTSSCASPRASPSPTRARRTRSSFGSRAARRESTVGRTPAASCSTTSRPGRLSASKSRPTAATAASTAQWSTATGRARPRPPSPPGGRSRSAGSRSMCADGCRRERRPSRSRKLLGPGGWLPPAAIFRRTDDVSEPYRRITRSSRCACLSDPSPGAAPVCGQRAK
jgi:hypothetical protein